MKKHEIVEQAEFGACRLVLIGLLCDDCGRAHDWMLVYHSPRPPRLDIVSDVIGKTGGLFSHVGDQVGINYDSQERAHEAFGMLLDKLLTGAGVKMFGDFRTKN